MRYLLSRIGRAIYYKFFRVQRRHYLAHLINKHQLKSFVEVGVWDGETSLYILKHCSSLQQITCIDNYAYSKEMRQTKEATQAMKIRTVNKLNHPKIRFIVNDDKIVLRNIKDESFDLVFLDHAHDYTRMKEAIKLWLPKIKPGGYLTGHQYEMNFLGCVRAVQETLSRVDGRYDAVWVYKK